MKNGYAGTNGDRPGLDQAMKIMREGDTLIVWKLDRLGRSLQHLIRVINDLNDNGKYLMSLQENIDSRFIYYGFNCTPRFRSIENVSMKDIPKFWQTLGIGTFRFITGFSLSRVTTSRFLAIA